MGRDPIAKRGREDINGRGTCRKRVKLRIGPYLKSGANDRIRTDDLLITNELLYQLSYIGFRNEGTCLRKCARRVNLHLSVFLQSV